MFNPTAELTISTGRPNYEANAEIKTQPLTAETKTKKCSKQFKDRHTFLMLFTH